jgi:anti-sigma B factor antagonist
VVDAKPMPDELLVAVHNDTALVRVLGRGSFKAGPTLKQFGVMAIEQGCRRFILDMDGCLGMDSTFMGVLAGLALRLRREDAGVVVMMNLSDKTSYLLETLGLDRLLELYPAGCLDDALKEHLSVLADVSRLELEEGDQRLTLETMLEAHQDLVEAAPENLPKFKSVIEYVGQDLQQIERP